MISSQLNISNILATDLLINLPKPNRVFEWKHIGIEDVFQIVGSLKNTNSKDYYDVSNKFLKQIIPYIALPLTICINDSLNTGLFPDCLKISKVIPIFKSGDASEPSNYRPISLIPIFAKIFETVMRRQICEYFEINNLFVDSQFGFRAKLNTTKAVTSLVGYILEALEDHQMVNSTFCDLTKAFDCVSHGILLDKLHYYGFGGTELQLLKSYLTNRRQCVLIDNKKSKILNVTAGVPQGSVLGPVLFLVMINDLTWNVSSHSIVFADDTTFVSKHKDLVELKHISNVALVEAKTWFNANKFVLNNTKTSNMLFTTKSNGLNEDDGKCNNCFKLLGIMVDSNLTWEYHIDFICKKLSRIIYLLRNLKMHLPKEYIRVAYYSYFQSVFSYGLLLWGNSAHIQKVFLLQKRAIRIITNSAMREHCKPLFIQEKVMTITCLYIYQVLHYVKDNYSTLSHRKDVHDHNTRSRDLFETPKYRLTKTANNFSVMSLKIANKFPSHIFHLDNTSFGILIS